MSIKCSVYTHAPFTQLYPFVQNHIIPSCSFTAQVHYDVSVLQAQVPLLLLKYQFKIDTAIDIIYNIYPEFDGT